MKNVEVIFDNKWIQMKSCDNKGTPYIFSHEKRCDGKIISILPFKREKNKIKYLLINQFTPCWNEYVWGTITGGFENDFIETVKTELWEEIGLEVSEDRIISLGMSFGTKSTDSKIFLFAADISDLKVTNPDTEEIQKNENINGSLFVNEKTLIELSKDPFTFVILNRLKEYLNENKNFRSK